MLNAHPHIHCPDELDFIFDHFTGPDAHGKYGIDHGALARGPGFQKTGLSIPQESSGPEAAKNLIGQLQKIEPGTLAIMVHRNTERILATTPEAKFVHFVRDPRDVGRSSVGMGWAKDVYFGIDFWLRTERQWDTIKDRVPPSQILEVRYESLIQDAEGALREICGFLGRDYDPDMLNYSEDSTYAAPDPSLIEQWRQKLSETEIGWIEGKVGPYLTSRGYTPSGVPPLSPSGWELARLKFLNKLHTKRVQIGRYGLGTVLLRKLGNVTNARFLQDAAQKSINRQRGRYLK